MLTECLSAACVLGFVVLALLLMTQAITLKSAMQAIAKAFCILFLGLAAICLVVPLVRAGVTTLTAFLKTASSSILVTVFVIAAVIVCLRALFAWRSTRKQSDSR